MAQQIPIRKQAHPQPLVDARVRRVAVDRGAEAARTVEVPAAERAGADAEGAEAGAGRAQGVEDGGPAERRSVDGGAVQEIVGIWLARGGDVAFDVRGGVELEVVDDAAVVEVEVAQGGPVVR